MKSTDGLHVIIGGNSFERTTALARIAEDEGASVIQLREKMLPTGELLALADALRKIIHRGIFIVNDRSDIALATGADGVHLGQDDFPIAEARAMLGDHAIIGASTSNIEQALEAEREGANYIGFGHLFPTSSKEKVTPPRTLSELKAVISAVNLPVIAIGGITLANIGEVSVAGLGGVAVIGAVRDAPNPREVIHTLVRMLEESHATFA